MSEVFLLEIEVLDSGPKHMEFKIKGERHTFAQMLKYYLLKEPSVEFASYKLEYPFDKDTLFLVRVKKGKPTQALRNANKSLLADLKEFKKKVVDAFK